MMKKIVLGTMLLTFVLLMSTALVGCAETDTNTSANPADAGKITLELWDWWGDGTHKAVIEQIVSDFNASQDKIVVEHVHYPWGDVWTKALAGNRGRQSSRHCHSGY
ncbi:Maltose-binding periplasmic proteins/domains [Actinobacillus pleuropneumoniae]|nr:Maltose-binding periplasmic proteins/domains [Actinobacillus pleuropneumoniae]